MPPITKYYKKRKRMSTGTRNRWISFAQGLLKAGGQPMLAAGAELLKGRERSGQGVTLQKDRALIYRRRRAPRRLRRRMRRSFRSFKSKVLKMKGHRTWFTNSTHVTSGLAGSQAVTSYVLFGGRVDGAVSGSIVRGYDDMNDLRSKDYLLGDVSGDAQFRFSNGEGKWYVKTAVLDCTLQNNSNSQPLEIDVYEFTCGNIITAAGTDVESALVYYQNPDVYPQGTGLTTYNLNTRGVTPFEFGNSMSKIRMKILKKTKYFLPVGDTLTYQIRSAKIRTMTHAVFRNNSCTTPYTRGILVISKPTVANADQAFSYTMGITRKYKYVVDESNMTRAGLSNPLGP